jgi:hypothetical protein
MDKELRETLIAKAHASIVKSQLEIKRLVEAKREELMREHQKQAIKLKAKVRAELAAKGYIL